MPLTVLLIGMALAIRKRKSGAKIARLQLLDSTSKWRIQNVGAEKVSHQQPPSHPQSNHRHQSTFLEFLIHPSANYQGYSGDQRRSGDQENVIRDSGDAAFEF